MMADGFDGIYRAQSPCARRALHCAGSRKVIWALVLCCLILLHLQVRTLLCFQNRSCWYPFIQCDFHSNTYPTSDRRTGTILTLFNPLKPELNPICYLLALLGAHHFLHVSRIRVKLLTFRLLMSHIYAAPIIDVSRSHTTTQHSR